MDDRDVDAIQGLTVSSNALSGAPQLLKAYGVDARLVARLSDLDLAALSEVEARIPLKQHLRFLNTAALACKEPQFGIELACHQGLELLGPIWILARQAETVGDCLESIGWALDLYSSALSLRLHRETYSGALLDYHIRTDSDDSDLQAVEQSLALLCNQIRIVAGPRWQPSYVQFRHAAPASMTKHRRVFGQSIYFNQDKNALSFEQKTLDLRTREGAAGHRVIRQHLRMQRDLRGESLPSRVAQVVRNLLLGDGCSVCRVADALGLSPRTLQHQLSQAGTSYQAIFDDVRIRLAQRYLQESRLSVAQIAEMLRFSESSAFSRFFQKQTGDSPRRCRTRPSH